MSKPALDIEKLTELLHAQLIYLFDKRKTVTNMGLNKFCKQEAEKLAEYIVIESAKDEQV